MNETKELLKSVFGFETFRPGQEEIVSAILAGRDVLAIMQAGDTAVDPYDNKHFVTLPDERAGLLIIYKSFEKVSYGLVVRARRSMHVGDVVAPPQLSDL